MIALKLTDTEHEEVRELVDRIAMEPTNHEEFSFLKVHDHIVRRVRRAHVADVRGLGTEVDHPLLPRRDRLIRIGALGRPLRPLLSRVRARNEFRTGEKGVAAI